MFYNYAILFTSGFHQQATAPYDICVNGGASLKCIVEFEFYDRMVVTLDAVWKRNGYIVDSLTPRHDLIRNSMVPPRVIGVLIKDIKEYDDGVEYTCTVNHAPDYFNSTVILKVLGMDTCGICC